MGKEKTLLRFKLFDENGLTHYNNDLKKIINITAALTFYDNYVFDFYSTNYKKIRLCNQKDFENVDYIESFEEN